MLEDLDEEFVEERRKIERKEADHVNEYKLLTNELDDGIKFAEADIEEKSARLSEYNAQKSTADGDLSDHTANLKDDSEYLASSKATCEVKASAFKGRTKLREEELEAINKAIEILASNRGKGHATNQLPGMFLQLDDRSPFQARAAAFLRKRASLIHSDTLAQLATKVGGDVFTKVRQMVKDLIVKLMEEENSEAKQKGWCDKELATNEQARTKYTTNTEQLSASIDLNTAKIETLQTSINAKNKENSQLAQEIKDLTEQREEEKFDNEMTIRDAKEGQETVQKAIVVLKEFYAKASKATQLVQSERNARSRDRSESPEIFDAPYQGMSGLKGGVVGMMETVLSDFDRLEQETKSEEETAVTDFNKMKNENAQRQAENAKNVEHMTEQFKQAQTQLSNEKDDLEDAKGSLDKADRYYEKLKPTCVNAGESAEERMERRQQEIESLEDAEKILNGQVV